MKNPRKLFTFADMSHWSCIYLELLTVCIHKNNDEYVWILIHVQIPKFWPFGLDWGASMTSKMTATKVLKVPGTSVEMTFFRLIFNEIVEWICPISGIYARFTKKMADCSQFIISQIIVCAS